MSSRMSSNCVHLDIFDPLCARVSSSARRRCKQSCKKSLNAHTKKARENRAKSLSLIWYLIQFSHSPNVIPFIVDVIYVKDNKNLCCSFLFRWLPLFFPFFESLRPRCWVMKKVATADFCHRSLCDLGRGWKIGNKYAFSLTMAVTRRGLSSSFRHSIERDFFFLLNMKRPSGNRAGELSWYKKSSQHQLDHMRNNNFPFSLDCFLLRVPLFLSLFLPRATFILDFSLPPVHALFSFLIFCWTHFAFVR